jgi:hypothetical protein
MRAALVASLAVLALAVPAAGASLPSSGHLCPPVDGPPFDARELVGLRVSKARRIAERSDCLLRVVRRHGEPLVVTHTE